jgi:formate dehydrogenase accessory protein FdhE
VTRGRRGRPGRFDERLARAQSLRGSATVGEPIALACALLQHQARRASARAVTRAVAQLTARAGGVPLLDVTLVSEAVLRELDRVVEVLTGQAPPPLAEAGRELVALPADTRHEAVHAWATDLALVDPRAGFWICAAAAPILELAAATTTAPKPGEWHGAACPMCGGAAQVSVIAERTGELLGGSPRSLVCARCAFWWGYPRATCPLCGEDDPRRVSPYEAQGLPWVRIDACDTCSGYMKTFDLRQDGARDVVPLVDDIASLALDVWANTQGLHRPVRSLAGV